MYAAKLVKLHWQPIMPRALFQKCVHVMVCAKMNNQYCPSFIWLAMIASCSHGNCAPTWGAAGTQMQICWWVPIHPSCWEHFALKNLKPQSRVWQKSLHSSKWVCVCYMDINTLTWGYLYVNKTTWLTSSVTLVVTGRKKHQLNTLHVLLLPGSARTPLCPCSPCADLWADPHQDQGVTPDLLQTRGRARQCLTSLGDTGSAGKAKQAGVQLSYKAQASLSILGPLNEAKGDFWK